MAFLSGSNNRFKFEFPKAFVPKEIEEKYSPVLNRIPGNMCQTVIDFVNYSIKSVEMQINPESYEPIIQTDRATPFGRISRSDAFPDLLWNKDMTITFQLDASYLIWFIMCDLFMYYYTVKPKFLPANPGVEMLDQYDNVIYRVNMSDILFTGVTGLEFDFSNRSIDQQTIQTTFKVQSTKLEFNISKP